MGQWRQRYDTLDQCYLQRRRRLLWQSYYNRNKRHLVCLLEQCLECQTVVLWQWKSTTAWITDKIIRSLVYSTVKRNTKRPAYINTWGPWILICLNTTDHDRHMYCGKKNENVTHILHHTNTPILKQFHLMTYNGVETIGGHKYPAISQLIANVQHFGLFCLMTRFTGYN